MSEFKRLLDDPATDALEADVLRLARSEGPSASARAKILAAVGAGLATASTQGGAALAGTQGASIAPTAAKSASLVKWLIAGTAVLVPAGIWLAVFSTDKPAQPLQLEERKLRRGEDHHIEPVVGDAIGIVERLDVGAGYADRRRRRPVEDGRDRRRFGRYAHHVEQRRRAEAGLGAPDRHPGCVIPRPPDWSVATAPDSQQN